MDRNFRVEGESSWPRELHAGDTRIDIEIDGNIFKPVLAEEQQLQTSQDNWACNKSVALQLRFGSKGR